MHEWRLAEQIFKNMTELSSSFGKSDKNMELVRGNRFHHVLKLLDLLK